MAKKIISIIVFVLFLVKSAHANIIRDSEIEEAINLVVAPLKQASGIKDLKILLINDETPNAFTVGGS